MSFYDACTAKHSPACLMDLTDSEYFAMEGKLLSAHTIIRYSRDPENFWNVEDKPASSALTFGSAVHKLLLEGREAFDAEYLVYEGTDAFHEASGRFVGRSSKRWQAILEMLGNPRQEVLNRKEGDRLFGMMQSFRSSYTGLPVDSLIETTVFWSMHGCRWRGKIDAMSPGNGLVVDIKTTADVNEIETSIEAYGYGLQAAVYCSAYKELYGEFPRYQWVFIGKSEPYDVVVREYDGLELWTDLESVEFWTDRFRNEVIERERQNGA